MDASVTQDGKATWGCIFRDEKAKVVHICAESGNGLTPLKAEARAMGLARKEATKIGLDFILLESDSLIVTDSVSGAGRCPWEIDMMISEIRAMVQFFKGVQIRHICREANGTADKIAKLRQQLPTDGIKHHNELRALVHSDAIGCGFTCG